MSPFLPGDRVMAVFSDGRDTAIGTVLARDLTTLTN